MDSRGLDRIIALARKDSRRGARVVAKVFYKILRKEGFNDGQIISIASNILECLIQSLKSSQTQIDERRPGKNTAPWTP